MQIPAMETNCVRDRGLCFHSGRFSNDYKLAIKVIILEHGKKLPKALTDPITIGFQVHDSKQYHVQPQIRNTPSFSTGF